MSGNDALEVRRTFGVLEGCDEAESELCREFAETLVRRASAVICGAKPVALYSWCVRDAREMWPESVLEAKLGELFEVYRAALRDHGLEIEPLHFSRSRVMTMAYRLRLVEDVLSDPRNRAFLARSGYCVDGAEGLVRSMRLRLLAFYQTREKDACTCSKAAAHGFPASSEQGFPHEMGLLFGYPLEDVRGFISGGKATCRGAWISYGDVAKSRRRFEALSRIERECRGRYRAGATLGALLESA